MALIANLAVGVTATTGALRASLRTAAGSVRQFATVVQSTQARLAAFGGAIVAAGAAMGAGVLVKNAYASIDSMAKLSDRLDISTQDLAGLKLGADLAGVGFDELTTALEKLEKGLGNPSQETTKALDQLGLKMKDLVGKGAMAQMTTIADRFRLITSAEDRAAIATALFGKAGQALIPLLMDGSAGLKAAAGSAEALNLTFSRLDAAKVEAANEAVTMLKGAFEGLAIQMAISSAPFLTAIADNLTTVIAKFGGPDGLGSVVSGAFDLIAKSVRTVGNALFELNQAPDRLATTATWLADKYQAVHEKLATAIYGKDSGWVQDIQSQRFGLHQTIAKSNLAIGEENGNRWGDVAVDKITKVMKDIGDESTKKAKERVDELGYAKGLKEWKDEMARDGAWRGAASWEQGWRSGSDGNPGPGYNPTGRVSTPNTELFNLIAFQAQTSNRIGALADRGTRGTFAADAAGRMVGSASIPQRQLEKLDQIEKRIKELADGFTDGIPLA